MKNATLVVALLLGATPAFAQFGVGEITKRAGQAQQLAELSISEKEERDLGDGVSATVRSEFGVVQDAALTKYVSLVGNVLAKASSRPDLKWEFIVLDTDGVNAFAAPGGLVHITKGALGLLKTESELAGVLGHEIAHITKKHTVNAIKKSKATKMGTEEVGSRTNYLATVVADLVYDNVVENKWDRGDEDDADQEGVRLANKAGYNPAGLTSFLQKLMDRNKDYKGSKPNGLFATHPDTRDRIVESHQADQDGESGVYGDGGSALRRDREVRSEAGDGRRHQHVRRERRCRRRVDRHQGRAEEGREEGRRDVRRPDEQAVDRQAEGKHAGERIGRRTRGGSDAAGSLRSRRRQSEQGGGFDLCG